MSHKINNSFAVTTPSQEWQNHCFQHFVRLRSQISLVTKLCNSPQLKQAKHEGQIKPLTVSNLIAVRLLHTNLQLTKCCSAVQPYNVQFQLSSIMPRLSEAQRNQVRGMVEAGVTHQVIVVRFNCHRHTIATIVRRHEQFGHVRDQPRAGCPQVPTARQDHSIQLAHLQSWHHIRQRFILLGACDMDSSVSQRSFVAYVMAASARNDQRSIQFSQQHIDKHVCAGAKFIVDVPKLGGVASSSLTSPDSTYQDPTAAIVCTDVLESAIKIAVLLNARGLVEVQSCCGAVSPHMTALVSSFWRATSMHNGTATKC